MTRKTKRKCWIPATSTIWVGLFLLVVLSVGCQTQQPTLSPKQVDELLGMSAQSAAASRELVEHDAKSRQAWLTLYGDLQTEVARIHRQQDQLEADRRALAQRQHITPVLAAAVEQLGFLAMCLLPVLVAIFLLWPGRPQAEHELVSAYLVETLIKEQELPRLEHSSGKDRRS